MAVAVKAWNQYPSDNPDGSYGKITDPLGPYKKPDVNFAVPSGVPITTLVSGMVTNVSDHGRNGGGLSVVVLMDTPLNRLATHVAYNYLGSATVRVGQRVQMGQQVGVAGSPYGIDMALALTSDDVWGNGTFNLNASGNPLLDPHILMSGNIPTSPGGGLSGLLGNTPLGQSFMTVSNTTHEILNNVPGFQGIVEALDVAETFVPFQMVNTGGQNVGILGNLPIVGGIIQGSANLQTLPSDTMQALLTFVTANTMAALIRLLIILVGIVILWALIKNAMDSGLGSSAKDVVGAISSYNEE